MFSGDRSHFTLSAADYERARSGHLDTRRSELVTAALDAYTGEAKTVLEIGFGSGKQLADLAARFPALTFYGTEVEPKMVIYAQETYSAPNLHYKLVDVAHEQMPLRCDFVYSVDVIHHIHEPLSFFRAVRALLVSGGTWLAIEPNIFHPYIFYQQERMRRIGLDEDHFRPWRLLPLIQQAGFEVAQRRFVFVFPGSVRRLPSSLAEIERRAENHRFIGGSVAYRFDAVPHNTST